MEDLEDLLEFSGGSRRNPCLVEVGRALRGGESSVGYVWSTGRVGATVGADGVRVRRRFGVMGPESGLFMDRCALQRLRVACDDWAARRHGWAAFFFSASGYPAGFGGGYRYWPPGKGTDWQLIGSVVMGRRRGSQLTGRDDLVQLAAPVRLSEDVRIEAEIWRRGEKQGPPEGSLVGLRYVLSDEPRVQFDARREGGEVRGVGEVNLEPGEEAFIAALNDVAQGRQR